MPSSKPATRRFPAVLVSGLLVVIAAVGYSMLASSASVAAPPDAIGAADGVLPTATSVFDDQLPGVAKLDPALHAALRKAATDSRLELLVDSGWRSPAYQEQLLLQAVSTYGSEEAAARWVATPTTSPHVSGKAVDLGPADATAWLSAHGARYGLCQIYRNEPWHYELRPTATAHGCPPTYVDPTRDPRMRGAK